MPGMGRASAVSALSYQKDGMMPSGVWFTDSYGDSLYKIGFTAYQGSDGWVGAPSVPVAPAPPSSARSAPSPALRARGLLTGARRQPVAVIVRSTHFVAHSQIQGGDGRQPVISLRHSTFIDTMKPATLIESRGAARDLCGELTNKNQRCSTIAL